MRNYKYHILYWIINYTLYCLVHFGTFFTEIYWFSLFVIFIHICGYIIVFYTMLFYVVPLLWDYEKYGYFVILFLIISISISILKIEFLSYLPTPEKDDSDNLSKLTGITFDLLTYTMFLPFIFTFYYAEKITQQQQVQREIEQENFKLEQSIIDTQLNNLKNQINPDFLFRKLDYFYQESLPHSASLSKGISLLSDMMHYAIDDDDEEGKVPLEKEITHIRNFIEINQLRFDGRLQVVFEVVGEVGSLKIMPLILITFVENAFKYGELMDAQNPLKISLTLKGNNLFFSTYNRTRRGPKEQSEGIGMANTQKRLALAYPDQHRLEIKSETDFYEVALEMKLT
jgi:two-component system, LytTR family, sensor kinase